METTEFHFNKLKCLGVSAGSGAAATLIFFGIKSLWTDGLRIGPVIYSIILGGLLLLFGTAAIFFFVRLVSSKPAFVISDDGFTDCSSLSSAGFIRWTNIENIILGDVEFKNAATAPIYVPMMIVYVKDAEEVLKNLSWLKRLVLGSDMKSFGAAGGVKGYPIKMTIRLLKEPEKLLKLLHIKLRATG